MSINSIKAVQFVNKINNIEKKNKNPIYKNNIILKNKKQKNQDLINLNVFFKRIKNKENNIDINKIEKIRISIKKDSLCSDLDKIANALIQESIFLSK